MFILDAATCQNICHCQPVEYNYNINKQPNYQWDSFVIWLKWKKECLKWFMFE